MTYQGIVSISNEVRFVLDTTREVNLAAQNASLAARRAGNVRGFQAVSSALKAFSQELAHDMSRMSAEILAIAEVVSMDYRLRRFSRYFSSIVADSAQGELLDQTLEGVGRHRSGVMNELDGRLSRLGPTLERSLRLCSKGRALARSATIEAAYGGESENMLKNVAHAIERTIEDIYARLKVIGMSLHNKQDAIAA